MFSHHDDVSLDGNIFRLNKYSGLFFDIKKWDFEKEKFSDFGFTYQALTHKLGNKLFFMGVQYQLPIFKGPIPDELLNLLKTPILKEKISTLVHKLFNRGKLERHVDFQLISQVTKNLTEEEKAR